LALFGNIKNEVLYRVYGVALLVLVASIVIFGRLYQISVVQAPYWQSKSDSLYMKWVSVKADRGNILAADGSLLATSLPFFDVHFDAKAEGLTRDVFMGGVDSLALMIVTHIDQQYTPGQYKEWLVDLFEADPATRGIRYVPIAKKLPYAKMMLLRKFPIFRLGRHKGGLIVEQKSERERPFKLLAQRTIGYVRGDSILPVGLEGSFNEVLGGDKGRQLMLRVPGDYYIPVSDLAEIEPEAGNDLVTTIDINIQDVTERSLLEACETHDADHGCAIVMEVKTGAIRAMANIGRTDEGWWETYNYAVGERVEPGSMFKLASFMSMMEDGHIDDLEQKVPVYGGKVKIYNEELRDDIAHGLDSMTIRQVFANSSNVGTATLMQQFYKARPMGFISRLEQFRLHQPTGIELGGEEAPIIKNPNDPKSEWSGTTLPWMSIGYELLLTPLQLLTFFNAVANDGRSMKPYLVQRTERYGDVVKAFSPQTLQRSIADKKTVRKARELMQSVVLQGTARNIRSSIVEIGGKTGTTQLNYHKFRASKGIRYQAGFCGFFPADNPYYTCIVVISEPQRAGFHGAEVAAPVFKKIAEKTFAMKAELHPAINDTVARKLTVSKMPRYEAGRTEDLQYSLRWLGLDSYGTPEEWAYLKPEGRDSLVLDTRNVNERNIPSVVGMGLKDALYLLENRGCKVRVEGVGRVRRQSLAVGSKANSGQTCVLYLE
jgi:cell division protein FtsI (penicillin-binding protein 3)